MRMEERDNSINIKSLQNAIKKKEYKQALKISYRLRDYYQKNDGPQPLKNYIERFISKYQNEIKCKEVKELKNKDKVKEIVRQALSWEIISELLNIDTKEFLFKIYKKDAKKRNINYLQRKIKRSSESNDLVFKSKYINWIDSCYINTHRILIRFSFNYDIKLNSISACQYVKNRFIDLSNISIRSGVVNFKFEAIEPGGVIFFAFYNKQNMICDCKIIPFPTLMRKGIHYSELCLEKPHLDTKNALNDYSSKIINTFRLSYKFSNSNIIVSHENQINSLYSTYIKDITDKLDITFAQDYTSISPDKLILVLPDNYIPTLSFLYGTYSSNNHFGECSPYIIASEIDNRPLYVFKPYMNELNSLNDIKQLNNLISQPLMIKKINNKSSINVYSSSHPVAVLITHEYNSPKYTSSQVNIFNKISKNNDFISHTSNKYIANKKSDHLYNVIENPINVYLFNLDDVNYVMTCLNSLILQKTVSINNVYLLCSTQEQVQLCHKLIKDKLYTNLEFKIILDIYTTQSNELIFTDKTEYSIFLDSSLCFISDDTLDNLISQMRTINTISNISSTLLHQQPTQKNELKIGNSSIGLFIESLQLSSISIIELVQMNIVAMIDIKNYSVISNSPNFVIWKTDVLNRFAKQAKNYSSIDDLHIECSILSVLNGYVNYINSENPISYQELPISENRYRLNSENVDLILKHWEDIRHKISIIRKIDS